MTSRNSSAYIVIAAVLLLAGAPLALAQVWGDHPVRCLKVSDDNGTTTTCICAVSDQAWHDTNCNQVKDAGEQFIIHPTTSAGVASIVTDETGTEEMVFATEPTLENVTINSFTGSPTNPALECFSNDSASSFLVDYSGRVAINDADRDAALTVRSGIEWSPADDDDLEFWFRVEDVGVTCSDIGANPGGITDPWLSVVGGYQALGLGVDSRAGDPGDCDATDPPGLQQPSHVCGHCCEWSDCTNIYGGCDCDDFVSDTELASSITSHVESARCIVGNTNGDYFDLVPDFVLDTVNDSFTIVALIKHHTGGWAVDTNGYMVSDTISGKSGTGDSIFVFRNHSSARAARWRADASALVDYTSTLRGTEDTDAPNCTDNLQDQGPGSFGVLTVQVEKTLSSELTMNLARMNGEDVSGGTLVATAGGIDFTVSYILGQGVRTVEFMMFHDVASTMSLADVQIVENYLSTKYSLGVGIADVGGALDEGDTDLGAEIDAFIVEDLGGATQFTVKSDGDIVGGNVLTLEDDTTQANACTFTVDSAGDLVVGPAGCDTTFSGATTIGATSSVDWAALMNYPAACDTDTYVTTIGDTNTCTLATSRDILNGTFRESFNALITESGGTVTLTVQQSGGGDLTTQFSSGNGTLDCAPTPCTVTSAAGPPTGLTLGTDTSPTENFVYVLQSAPTALAVSTSDWPATEHIKIAYLLLPSAAFVSTGGAYINQNWNDHQMGTDNMGHIAHMAERSRRDGAYYFSGVAGAGVEDYLTNTASNVELKASAGVIYQMHKQTIPAFDTSVAGEVLVVNWSGDSYHNITNLFDIVADSTGAAIAANRYFNFTIWAVGNKSGEYAPMMINLPSCSYAVLNEAKSDADGCDDFSIPSAYSRESSTGFLVARITVRRQTTWVVNQTTDLRGQTPSSASGSVSSVSTPGGVDTNVQFNDSGIFGGDANFTWDDAGKVLTLDGNSNVIIKDAAADTSLNITCDGGSDCILTFDADSTGDKFVLATVDGPVVIRPCTGDPGAACATADASLTLENGLLIISDIVACDADNEKLGTGALGDVICDTNPLTPVGGSTTQLQYNLSGALAGDANMTWSATDQLTLGTSDGAGSLRIASNQVSPTHLNIKYTSAAGSYQIMSDASDPYAMQIGLANSAWITLDAVGNNIVMAEKFNGSKGGQYSKGVWFSSTTGITAGTSVCARDTNVLTNMVNEVTTASASSCVTLPISPIPDEVPYSFVVVENSGANTLQIWASTTGTTTINPGAATSVNLAATKTAIFYDMGTHWSYFEFP